MRLIFASEAVTKAAFGCFKVKRTVRSPVFSILAMSATKGRYIGTLGVFLPSFSSSIPGASKEYMMSSGVTGLPSCHVMPARIVASSVVGLTHSSFSADQFRGRPSAPTRARRSQISSVTHELVPPAMNSGLIASTGSAALSTICFTSPFGAAWMKVQKLRRPMPL